MSLCYIPAIPPPRSWPCRPTCRPTSTKSPRLPPSSTSYGRARRLILSCAPSPAAAQAQALNAHVSEAWALNLDPSNNHAQHLSLLCKSPPIVRHSSLLTPSECACLIKSQSKNTSESSLYLNYRVNKQLTTSTSSQSSEAAELIAATRLSAASSLSASSPSGFRSQIPSDNSVLHNSLLPKLKGLLGISENRKWVFEEGAWVRPNSRQIIIRDATTVFYRKGEGVPPHVDGKDLTVLICLKEPGEGGATVFTKEEVAVRPQQGAGILYQSKESMPHFAQVVEDGEKWVLQLLIDFVIRDDEMDGVDYTAGTVYS